jgi:DNA-binding MarR family transcriptional regulator
MKRYEDLDELNLKLIVTLTRCSQSVTRRDGQYISSQGLTLPQFGVLEALYHLGPLKVGEIIEKTLSSSGNVGVIIDNLIKDGFLEKSKDDVDKRVTIVRATEKGKKKIEDIFPGHLDNIRTMFDILSPEEKNIMISLLKKLGKSL